MKKVNNKLYPDGCRAKKLLIAALVADIIAGVLFIATIVQICNHPSEPKKVEVEKIVPETKFEEMVPEEPYPTIEPVDEAVIEETPIVVEPVEPIVEVAPSVSTMATDAEIELLALVTMAEAEGESVEGKRLVIDTVLNRVDSPRWPNTISEVIYQPNQFVAMSNGRAERCQVTDEVRQLVREELLSRTNTEVVYFTAGGYGRYGTPVFQVGNHYFCK